ncbi:MAG TPA: PD-(D/E)XK nuclease family protein [Burkholderiales bacterium]|nr:PD-(D/E)XK nuclease family protein [Burkholderiales bacterium]
MRLHRAALTILEQCAVSGTDLRDATVLVPNFHAAAELGSALLKASAQPVLLAPQITTFPAWAASVSCGGELMPDSRRTAVLYQALKERAWFDPGLLWTMCDEIGRLFDELTYQAISLPLDRDEFASQVSAYYRIQRHAAVEFEARIVHELWYALSRNDLAQGELNPASLYALRLARLAQTAATPLFVVSLSNLTRLERNCLEQYAHGQSVTYIDPDEENDCSRTLHAAWPKDLKTALIARARGCAEHFQYSPLAGRIGFCGASNLEEEAAAADTQVRCWLAEGKQNIALVVQDRMSARRLRALLERAQILVADETGWSLDTTQASTVVMRWLEALSSDFPYQDVLDLLKSGYILSDWTVTQRDEAVRQIEQVLRDIGPMQGCARLLRALQGRSETDEAQAAVSRMQKSAAAMLGHAWPLERWLARLESSLNELGALSSLAADTAGAQLLALMALRRQELAKNESRFDLAEFHRWLGRELENGLFIDAAIVSPVVFTHLAATRLRHFDAVLILGGDATHLPSLSAHSVFFNQSVRSALGLPTHAGEIEQIQDDLLQLICNADTVRVLWRTNRDGEINPISPWLERLDRFHCLAWGMSLIDNGLLQRIPAAQIGSPDRLPFAPVSRMPQVLLPTPLIPAEISVTGYNTLIACPYQYYARLILGLNEPDEISAEMEKSDYGQAVHAILYAFHASHPVLCDLPYDELLQDLTGTSLEFFAPGLENDYYVHAWQKKWLSKLPLYLEWQIGREKDGWFWHGGELARRREYALQQGRTIALYGRLDRIDKNVGKYAILDYKTGNPQGLKYKLRQVDEDVQLPAYVILLQAPVGQTAFVSLDGKVIDTIDLPEDTIPDASERCAERLISLFDQMYGHIPLPANGTDEVCRHCTMRGLCRRDQWETVNPDAAG